MFRTISRTVTVLAAAAVLAAFAVAPASAYMPTQSDYLHLDNFNLKAQDVGGNNWLTLGDLKTTRYAVVRATNVKGAAGVTMTLWVSGREDKLYVQNNQTVLVDFGKYINTDTFTEMQMQFPRGTQVTNVTLDVYAVSSGFFSAIAAPTPAPYVP
jgi:hypothetical protein